MTAREKYVINTIRAGYYVPEQTDKEILDSQTAKILLSVMADTVGMCFQVAKHYVSRSYQDMVDPVERLESRLMNVGLNQLTEEEE